MATCSSAVEACPPGFLAQAVGWLVLGALVALVCARRAYRIVSENLANGKMDDNRKGPPFFLWTTLLLFPVAHLDSRSFVRGMYEFGPLGAGVFTVAIVALALLASGSSGPLDLKLAMGAFGVLGPVIVCAGTVGIRRAVKRGGGLDSL